MLAKVITYAPTRHAALLLLDRVLAECAIVPAAHQRAFLRRILGHESFRAGHYDITFVEQLLTTQLSACRLRTKAARQRCASA